MPGYFTQRWEYWILMVNFWIFRNNDTVLGCAGFHGDCLTLTKVINAHLQVSLVLDVEIPLVLYQAAICSCRSFRMIWSRQVPQKSSWQFAWIPFGTSSFFKFLLWPDKKQPVVKLKVPSGNAVALHLLAKLIMASYLSVQNIEQAIFFNPILWSNPKPTLFSLALLFSLVIIFVFSLSTMFIVWFPCYFLL